MVTKGKILYCASTIGHLQNFHLPYIQALAKKGYAITICAEQKGTIPFAADFFLVPFCKKITSLENLKNIFKLYCYLKKERFAAISVHTTLAAVTVRAAILLLPRKKRPKVFYTCHGYLFSNKDGWRKWKYLLPEKICAAVTEVLMVMNQEDQDLAKYFRLYKEQVIMVPGMGVDFSRFDLSAKESELRKKYNIAQEEVLFVFAGEFSHRKNQQQLIRAFAQVVKQIPKAKLILAGDGALWDDCKQQAKQLQLQNKNFFPGQVADIPALYQCCDVCISASKIEGLPFNIMEAMYCGLPCIASAVKGHEDLIQHSETGYLYKSETELANYMIQLYQNIALRQQMGQAAKQAVQQYGLQQVLPVIMQVYEENL